MQRIIKQLFRKREHPYVRVYLERFKTLETLIADDRLGIDHKKRLVIIDSSIHCLYMDDDKKYNAFFDTIRAYMNTSLGQLGIKEMIEYSDKIDFLVMMKRYIAYDDEKEEFFSPPKEVTKPILVGFYEHGVITYETYIEKDTDLTDN